MREESWNHKSYDSLFLAFLQEPLRITVQNCWSLCWKNQKQILIWVQIRDRKSNFMNKVYSESIHSTFTREERCKRQMRSHGHIYNMDYKAKLQSCKGECKVLTQQVLSFHGRIRQACQSLQPFSPSFFQSYNSPAEIWHKYWFLFHSMYPYSSSSLDNRVGIKPGNSKKCWK